MGNREIKFRVWDSQLNKFLNLDGSVLMHPESGNLHGSRSGGNVETWHLQQFTGWSDAEGELIYEGDILECDEHFHYQISWSEKHACWYASDCGGLDELPQSVKVIGNIYQNPELLK